MAVGALSGCGVAEVESPEPIFFVEVLSPRGGTFTVAHFNESGAGGGPTNPLGTPADLEGTGSFQEVIRLGPGPVDPSLQYIRGSFTGSFLEVRLLTRRGESTDPGEEYGAEAGSIVSTEGPDPSVSACSVRYEAASSGTARYEVQFRFTDGPGRLCRGT